MQKSMVILTITKDTDIVSRGLDNNNPMILNQVTPDPWEGLSGNDPDGLLIFDSEQYGLRAGMINLYNVYYLNQYTITDFANTYFPEDNTHAIAFSNELVRHLDLSSITDKIPEEKWKDVPCVVAYFGSGWKCDLNVLNEAVDMLPNDDMKNLFRNPKPYTPSREAKTSVTIRKSFYERYKYIIIGLLLLILIALIVALTKKKK